MTALRYGPHPAQHAVLVPGRGEGPRPCVALVHGGCFRARYGPDQMEALAADVAARGWAALVVGYRRLDAGARGAEMAADVAVALGLLASAPGVDPARVAVVGHSAGGCLALLAAPRARGVAVVDVVAQAPVLDLRAAVRDGACRGAAGRALAGGLPSPADAPPPLPHLVVHGDADEHVPVGPSRRYAARVRHATYVELAGCGHMEHIDPRTAAWQTAAERLATTLEAS